MKPVQTQIALLVSLIGLGWSSAGATENQIPGPNLPPEPSTPFGVPSWPENWSFYLSEATRSAYGDSRQAAPEETTSEQATRYKTGSVPVSFQDHAFQSQHYVCVDVDTGLVARAATGCRIPAALPDRQLAAEAAPAVPQSLATTDDAGNPPAAVRHRASSRRAGLALEGSADELSRSKPSRSAAGQDGSRRGRSAEASLTPKLAKSAIRADLGVIHREDPFSLPDAVELAQAQAKRDSTVAAAATTNAVDGQVGGGKQAAALVVGHAKQRPDSTAATRELADSTASSSVRFAAQAKADDRTDASEQLRSATMALAGLRLFHDECPFSVPDANTLAEAKGRSTLADAAARTVARAPSVDGLSRPADAASSGRTDRKVGASGNTEPRKIDRAESAPKPQPAALAAERAGATSAMPSTGSAASLPLLGGAYPFWLPEEAAPSAEKLGPIVADSAALQQPLKKKSAKGSARPQAMPLPDKPSAFRRAITVASKQIAGLAMLQEEGPFSLPSDDELAEARKRALLAETMATLISVASASAAPAPETARLTQRAENRSENAKAPAVGGATAAADKPAAEVTLTPATKRQGNTPETAVAVAARKAPQTEAAHAAVGTSAQAQADNEAAIQSGRAQKRPSSVESIPVDVYGVLAEQYAANLKQAAVERQAKARSNAQETNVDHLAVAEAKPAADRTESDATSEAKKMSAPDTALVEVYGVLGERSVDPAVERSAQSRDETRPKITAATSAEQVDRGTRQPAAATRGVARAAEVEAAASDSDGALSAAANLTTTPPAEEVRATRRVEIDAATIVSRATDELLVAIERWAAQVAKVDVSTLNVAAPPKAIADPGENPFSGGGVALAEAALDGVRGGFDNGSGLRIAFGIERAVYINGNLVTTTNFNVADLGKVTAGQSTPVNAADAQGLGMLLVQNGPGNVVQPGVTPGGAATVIQNTLNNQNIGTVTLVNATVNSLQMIKGLSLHSTLRNVVANSVLR